MSERYRVTVLAGSMRDTDGQTVHFPHPWTPEGVDVVADFTGAHLLHLAAAGCVLNDVYREAAKLDLPLDGVRVDAEGGFDRESWTSNGVVYAVQVDSPMTERDLEHLLEVVDGVAEIPRAIRAGAPVGRINRA